MCSDDVEKMCQIRSKDLSNEFGNVYNISIKVRPHMNFSNRSPMNKTDPKNLCKDHLFQTPLFTYQEFKSIVWNTFGNE